MSDDLIDRLTAAFMGHADHVNRNLFGRARDALEECRQTDLQQQSIIAATWDDMKHQKARAKAAEAKLREAVEVMRQISMACDTYGEDLSFGDMKTVHRIQQAARAFLATMEKPHDP